MATKKDEEKAPETVDVRDGTGGPDPKDNPITPDDVSE